MKQRNGSIIAIGFLVLTTLSFLQLPLIIANNDIQIAGEVGDILVYKFDIANETSYQKYNVTAIQPMETGLNISYNLYMSTLTSNFTTTPQNITTALITGNLSEDLFSDTSFFNLFLPLTANFSDEKEVLDDFVNEANEEQLMKAEYTLGPSGLNCRITLYLYLVVYIKFMEMEFYYSSTRVLLRSRFWVRNPQGSEQFEVILEIMPELSTPIGVNENPFDPLNITGASNSTDIGDNPLGDPTQNLIFDTKAILILTGIGIVIIGGPTSLIIYIRKKRKNRRAKDEKEIK